MREVALTRQPSTPHEIAVLPASVPKARKVELLRLADASARAEGGAIRSVTASYADSRRRILIANSDGLLTGDDQVRTRFGVQSVATGDTGMQTGTRRPDARSGSSTSTSSTSPRSRARRRGARSRCSTPVPRRVAHCPSYSRAVPEPCSSTRRAVTASKPISYSGRRRCSKARSASRSRLRSSR